MTIPDYLLELLEEAETYRVRNETTPVAAAQEIAQANQDLIRPDVMLDESDAIRYRKDPCEVIRDLKRLDSLCVDELDVYRKGVPSDDFAEAALQAIAIRSLEEFLASHLPMSEQYGDEHPQEFEIKP